MRKVLLFSMLICMLFVPLIIRAQIIFNGVNFGQTTPAIRGIGIGDFSSTTATNARFHISNFYCSQPTGPLNGFLFRTDGFKVGIETNGETLLNQQENPPMWFRVNNINAMQIEPDGLITINSLASCTDMLVIADKNGTLKTTDTETLLSQSKTIAQLQTRINELENKLNNLTAKNN
ncbi:MAG: hypothetical protein HY958_04005 [Bacteroidia bacterium]|nr:hypothetical protein [Bacteroidia bacterium]